MGLEEHIGWSTSRKPGEDPVDFYWRVWPGVPRGRLQKVDEPLYRRIRRDNDLHQIPTERRVIHDPVREYLQHFDGVPRGKLSKVDPGLYHKMWREDLLAVVPKKSDLEGNGERGERV